MTTITTGMTLSFNKTHNGPGTWKADHVPLVVDLGLIVYRILQVTRGVNSVMHAGDSGTRRLTRVVRILVESGLLYTVSVIVFFGTFLASNNAQYGVSDVVRSLQLNCFPWIAVSCSLITHPHRSSNSLYAILPHMYDAAANADSYY